jgi:hypothetical protein
VRIAAVFVLAVVFANCTFSQRHPAITAGIVGGAIGFSACAVDNARMKTCAIVGGGAAVFLGGIMALVTMFADTTDHSLPSDEEEEPEIIRPRKLATPIDAGVIDVAADATDAPTDAGVDDAVLSPTHD